LSTMRRRNPASRSSRDNAPEDWASLHRGPLVSAFACNPRRAAGDAGGRASGAIINITSEPRGWASEGWDAVYSAAKGRRMAFTKALRAKMPLRD